MAVNGIYMDAVAESGRNPVSKHQIQPEYGDERVEAGCDGRTCLARPNFQARTETGKKKKTVQLTASRIASPTRLTHNLLKVPKIHM